MRLMREASSSFAGGVNDAVAPDEYRADQVQSLINARISSRGNTIEVLRDKLALSATINETGADSSNCYGLIEFYLANGTQQWVGFFDDEMHYSTDQGKTWTQAATSLTEEYWSLVIYREGTANVLCCANGGTNSYQWNGSTWAAISNIPNGVKYLAVFGDRLIAAGHSGVNVAASAVGDIDTWADPDGYTVKATTHDGDTEIRGLFTLGSSLLVFKRKSVGFVEGFGYETLQVAAGARGISRSTGCVAHRSIAPVGDDGVMWLSERGFEFFQVGGRIQLASALQDSFVRGISYDVIRAHPGLPNAVWWPKHREYRCAVPVATGIGSAGLGNTRNTWTWCYRPATEVSPPAVYMILDHQRTFTWSLEIDENGELDLLQDSQIGLMAAVDTQGALTVAKLPNPGRFVTTQNGELQFDDSTDAREEFAAPACLAVADIDGSPGALIAGHHDNRVYHMENELAAALYARIRFRPMVFGDQATRKKAKRVTVLASQDSAVTGTLYVLTDGSYGTAKSLAFTANIGEEAQEKRARVGGKGRQIQCEYWTSGLQEIRGLEVEAALLGDQR